MQFHLDLLSRQLRCGRSGTDRLPDSKIGLELFFCPGSPFPAGEGPFLFARVVRQKNLPNFFTQFIRHFQRHIAESLRLKFTDDLQKNYAADIVDRPCIQQVEETKIVLPDMRLNQL